MTVHTDGRFIQQIKFRNRYSISMESIDIVRKQVAESERVKAELSKNEEVIAAIAKAADVCTRPIVEEIKRCLRVMGGVQLMLSI